ncbi:MAG: hypothetical protein LBF27_15055 [Sphingobacterium sp.]|jgi:hypothetical protein|nr:hypothetical protein [Sphingobacterium sp.]
MAHGLNGDISHFMEHVVIRVFEGGEAHKVYVLDEYDRSVKWESSLFAAE